MTMNIQAIQSIRIYANIFAGTCAGIMGFSAFTGILFWMFIGIITSALLFAKIIMMGVDKNGNSNYFVNILTTATANIFSNIMTYMIFWILFFNIVYVV